MKSKTRFIILLFLILVIPINIKAAVCSNNDKVRLASLASNVEFSYNYEEQNDDVIFSITINNIHEDLIIKDVKHNKIYNYQGNEIILYNFEDGLSYAFEFYSEYNFCGGIKINNKYVNLPSFNKYYNDSVCIGIENYKYCKKWQKITLNYEEFVSNVEQYNASLIKEETSNIQVKGFYDYIIEFYTSYYYIVLPLLIISGIVIIYYYNKKNSLF
ncbi:MAG: hypothetical protein ACK5HP_04945 [Bacilli bacterium]